MVTLKLRVCLAVVPVVLLGACATTDINPRAVTNPPPAERFASFGRFQLKEVQLAAAYSSDDAREATRIIQSQLDARLAVLVKQWNDDGRNARNPRALAIEPRIEQVKFLSAGARFWTGAMSGSSAVIMKVRYVDVATGRIVAEPEFYQHAAAMGGAWSFGATDQDMLKRVADLVSEYTARNYTKAVGGPTGATPDLVR
jgi:hypothetical protein